MRRCLLEPDLVPVAFDRRVARPCQALHPDGSDECVSSNANPRRGSTLLVEVSVPSEGANSPICRSDHRAAAYHQIASNNCVLMIITRPCAPRAAVAWKALEGKRVSGAHMS